MATRKKDAQVKIAGMSEASQKAALEIANAKIKSGQSKITLPIAAREVEFYLTTIPNEKILEMTKVASGNQRDSELLNEYYCEDILPSFIEYGQQTPAIGQMSNEVIEVCDGSRRRFGALFSGGEFKVYVTNETLTRSEVIYLSEVGNKHKHISLYERGRLFRELLDNDVYESQSALAEGENVDPAVVSISLKAFDNIPRALAKLIPAIDQFGRQFINQLTGILAEAGSLKADAKEKFMEQLLSIDIDKLKGDSGKESGKALNKSFMDYIQLIKPKKELRRKRPNKNILSKSGNTKITLTNETKKGFSIKIDNPSPDIKQKIIEFSKSLFAEEQKSEESEND